MSPPYSLVLNRVFKPSLCRDKIWYAVSTEWCSRPRHFSAERPFRVDFAEVLVYDLADQMARAFIIHRGLDRLERKIWSFCRPFSG